MLVKWLFDNFIYLPIVLVFILSTAASFEPFYEQHKVLLIKMMEQAYNLHKGRHNMNPLSSHAHSLVILV